MSNRLLPFVIPLIAFGIVITCIVAIGNLLLAVYPSGLLFAPLVALSLIVLVGVVSALLSARAAKLPPVELPGSTEPMPTRRMDLGAGYVVGQFVFFFALGLLLLIAILTLKH